MAIPALPDELFIGTGAQTDTRSFVKARQGSSSCSADGMLQKRMPLLSSQELKNANHRV